MNDSSNAIAMPEIWNFPNGTRMQNHLAQYLKAQMEANVWLVSSKPDNLEMIANNIGFVVDLDPMADALDGQTAQTMAAFLRAHSPITDIVTINRALDDIRVTAMTMRAADLKGGDA